MYKQIFFVFFVKERPPFIPEAVLKKRLAMQVEEQSSENPTVAGKKKRKLEKDIQNEMGADYFLDLKSN